MSNSHSFDFFRVPKDSLTSLEGRLEYVHTNKNQSGTAYPSTEGVSLLLSIPRALGAHNVIFNVYKEDLSYLIGSFEGKRSNLDYINESYRVDIPAEFLKRGLYFFDIEISTFNTVYGFKSEDKVLFSLEKHFGHKFQFAVFDEIYEKPENNLGGIIYHIFVDRFMRGGNVKAREDAVFIDDWSADIVEYPDYPGAFLKNNTFYGGTLWGIADKLDYLESLGVTTLYLSPIFEAYSNHKYDTGDYSKVDEMFGGEEALENLILRCKERGIGIILDGVFNHTGSDSVYFNKNGRYGSLGAYQSDKSPYYEWFTFQSHPEEYTSWWGIEILPRINPDVSSCRNYFTASGGIIEKYAKMGIDGFRLDVADELSDGFIADIKRALNRQNQKSVLYGEVWEDASNKIAYGLRKSYYLGEELDGVMNYPVRTGIIDFILNKSTDKLKYALTDVYQNMPKRARDLAMNLLGTHDTERILTVLGGIKRDGLPNSTIRNLRLSDGERKKATKRLKMAYTINATLPGIPSIYYGDEAGIEGYSDPFNRRTFPWGREDNFLIEHYKIIGAIRRENEVYREGEFEIIHLDSEKLLFKRVIGDDEFITVANNSASDFKLAFSSEVTNLLTRTTSREFILNHETATIFHSKKYISIKF